MSKTYEIKNVSSGEEIAENFGGLYLNRYHTGHKIVYESLFSERKELQYNFTLLCIEWLLTVGESNTFDARNEATVQIGRRMKASCKFNGLSYRMFKGYTYAGVFALDIDDFGSVSILLKHFLNTGVMLGILKKEAKAFCQTMIREHKTIQQNLTRFCFDWFAFLEEHSGGSGAMQYRLARLALQFRKPLPYI